MASTSKLSFRARNMDASKATPVYVVDELPDLAECTPINRAVAQMPTGMEKDEEMESHLQEAIIAQQASTSGIAFENHVIPTPKVTLVDKEHYDSIYPVQPAPSRNYFIKVQACLSLDKEQPDYDIDSEDEEWLHERPHISVDDFEKMMELLEGASSDVQICQPQEARSLLRKFDDDVTDDVYDYWLQKRKVATTKWKVASLIPRVKTDNRRDAPGSINPYVAFRRRAEKMQTRKNRKNDEESYEKILKLRSDIAKAVLLIEMIKMREKTKLRLLDLEAAILDSQMNLQSTSNCATTEFINTDGMTASVPEVVSSSRIANVKVRSHVKRKAGRVGAVLEKDYATRAWLKNNLELWNRPQMGLSISQASVSGTTIGSDVGRSTVSAMGSEPSADGRYTFKRRRGCVYRDNDPNSSKALDLNVGTGADIRKLTMDERIHGYANCMNITSAGPPSNIRESNIRTLRNDSRKFYRTMLPASTTNGVLRCIGLARRRIGRGGRIIYDRIPEPKPSTSHSTCFNDDEAIPDFTRTYQPIPHYSSDDDDSWWLDDQENASLQAELKERRYQEREEKYRIRIYGMLPSDSFSEEERTSQRIVSTAETVDRLTECTSSKLTYSKDADYANGSFTTLPALVDGGQRKCTIRLGVLSRSEKTGSDRQLSHAKIFGQSLSTMGNATVSTSDSKSQNISAKTEERKFHQRSSRPLSSVSGRSLDSSTPADFECDNPLQRSFFQTVSTSGMAEVGWKTVTVPPISQRQDGSAFHVRQRLPATTVKTEDGCSVTNNQCRSYGSALEPDSIVRLSNFDRDGVDNSVRTKSPDKTKSNKLSGNLEPPLVHSVGATVSSYKNDISGHLSTYDAKRLELAMAANRYHSVKTHGGHIMSQSALSPETHQQIHPKNCGTPRLSPVSNENNVQVPENYMGSRYLPPSVDSHSVGIRTSAALHNGCYTVSDGMNGMTSSPDSESMSPPLSNSPAVVPELSSRRFPSSDIEDQTPVAVISKRASLINLSAEDSRRSNGEMKNVRSENRIYQMSDHASTDRCRQQQLQSPPRPAIASVAPHSKRQKLVMSTSPQNNAYKSIISRQKKGSIDVLHVSNQMKSSVVDAININSALASSNNVSVLSVPSKLASPPIIQASEEGFASGVG